ncbi:asparagine synthase-related protein [Planobispora siamensis]|uniref:tRNA(Ile)-lysidine synthase TilS/MesJ n=1 Tax=Planobispora siamensis TaxID=936338 RepID=A0A8J3SN94_9ACTN|nr:asparagine synthase-related protein [Planobispora siamensis]GIH95937.1 hypothetical protein Psi01_65670 [Planobispora siamensis]
MAVDFQLIDRVGTTTPLAARPGATIAQVLMENFVPPLSVTVTGRGEVPLADGEHVRDGQSYRARLIEGYDLGAIRRLYTEYPGDSGHAYLKRRLVFRDDGNLTLEQAPFDMPDLARHVEDTVRQTIERFRLVQPGRPMVLGLSGGVDSGSLMLALGALIERGVPLDLTAATFEDFDSTYSDTFDRAHELAERFGVRHELIPADLARSVFHLDRPLRDVLPALMETEDSHQTMYVDHHTTRRTLEVFAAEHGARTIALGLHTTDLLAGLVNAQATGYRLGGIPLRAVGDFSYVFPLAFVPKKELDLYYLHATGTIPPQSPPNPWEFNPLDRNFYYYFADFMQSFWPGVEHWMFTGAAIAAGEDKQSFVTCGNCQGSLDPQGRDWTPGDFCDVCSILARYDYVKGI